MSPFHPTRLTAALVLTIAATATCYASSPYLTFTGSDGSQQSIATDGLELTFEGSTITAVNSAGAALTLDAAALQSMQFTDRMSSIAGIEADDLGEVTVYNLQGHQLGSYASAAEARRALATGIYILKADSGLTVKLSVR